MSGFALSKWYADCVTPAGDALILYSAELRWQFPPIHYTSLLTTRSSRFTLRKTPPPVSHDGAIEWRSEAWQTEARWRDLGAAASELLYQSDEGSLEWNCLAPRAAADFQIAGVEFHGWGYVEHLRLTLAPWRLPIHQLRWGRFVNAADALVWIDWRGPTNRRVVYFNGAPRSAATVTDREIALADGEAALTLDAPRTLRQGALGSTVLAAIPRLEQAFPARILQVREQKWLSQATLHRPGLPDSTGLAIHEVVEWP